MKTTNRICRLLSLLPVTCFELSVCSAQLPPPVRIMPLGDSITQGYADPVNSVEGGYRTRLYALLSAPEAGYNVDFIGTLSDMNNPALPDCDHEGHGGYRIETIRNNIASWLSRVQDPDVILLHIGTNDFWAGNSLEVTQSSLRNLLADLSALRPHAKIIVASLAPRTDIYETVQGQFNASLPVIVGEQVALGRLVSFVDIHSALAPQDLADGVHPTTSGYEKMADQWFTAVNQVITPLGTSDPPAIASVDARADLEQVTVKFSKPMEATDMVTANFSLSGGVSIVSAELDSTSKRIVTLTTNGLTRSTIYSMSVNGVHDLCGNPLPSGAEINFTSQTVIDGSFEANGVGWVSNGNVSVSDLPNPTAIDGMKLVTFNDGQTEPNGVVSQSIPTQPGQKYRLLFEMGVYAYNTSWQDVRITVADDPGGQVLLSQTEAMRGLGGGSTQWQTKTLEFVAANANTTISFEDVSLTTDKVDLLLDHVRLEAEIARTLTLNSSPSSGLNVAVSPLDLSSNGDGVTDFSRSYDNLTMVSLTAPAMAPDGTVFQKWQKNGVDYSDNRSTLVTMDNDYTMSVLYVPNTAPVAVADAYSGFVETPVDVAAPGVLGNDTDAQPVSLAAVLDTPATHGSVTLNPDGSFTYTPVVGYVGPDSFTYHANDGGMDSNVVTVSLTVNAAPAGLLVNGSFELGNPANAGSLYGWTTSGSQFGLMAGTNYTATEGNRLAVFSGGGNTFDGTISQTFPTTIGQLYSLELDMGIIGETARKQLLQVTIAGSNTLVDQFEEASAATGPAQWSPKGYSFVANSYTTTLTLRDASGSLLPSTVANNADLLVDNVRVTETLAHTLTVSSSPINGLYVQISQPDLNGSGSGGTDFSRLYGDGTVVKLTAPAFPDRYIFQKWQIDGTELTTNTCATLKLNGPHALNALYGVNTASVANADTYATTMEWPLTVSAPGVLGNDTDAEISTLTAVLDAAPSHGNVTLNLNGSFTYTPSAGYVGLDSFTYHANDGGLDSNVATVSLVIDPVGPFVNGSFESGTPVDFGTLDGWICTGNTVGYSSHPPNYAPKAGTGNRFAIFNGGNNAYDGSITQRFATIAGQTYRIRFNIGITGISGRTQRMHFTAAGGTTTPLVSTQEEITATGPATHWADPPKSYTFVADSAVTTLTFSDTSSVQANSSDLLLDHVQLAAISEVNRAPVALDDGSVDTPALTVIEDSGPSAPVAVLINDGDNDLDDLTVTQASSVNGSVSINSNGTLVFTPAPDFHGATTISYTISDGQGGTASATVFVAVTPVNDFPVALDDGSAEAPFITVAEDSGPSMPIEVLANDSDVDLDILTVTTASASNGTVTINSDETLVFTPPADFHGEITISYTITDGHGGTASATVFVVVTPVNDYPVALDDGSASTPYLTVDENSAASAPIAVLTNDSDIEHDPLTVTMASSPNGTVTINGDDSLSFTPAANFSGATTISYTVADGQGGTASATVFVAVTPVFPFVNGSFESGTPLDFGSLDGWTVTGNAVGYLSYPPNYAAKAGNGSRFTLFNSGVNVYNGSIMQRFATIAGQSYKIEFDMGITGTSGRTQHLQVTVMGGTSTPLLSVQEVITATGLPTLWISPTPAYTFTANSSATTLTFIDASNANANSSDLLLDNVRVTAISEVNHAPVALDDGSPDVPFISMPEDSGPTAPIAVLTNDSDSDSDNLSVIAASSLNGTVTINGNGTLVFAPAANYHGATTIGYTISDGKGGTANATLFVTVTPVNDTPVAQAMSAAVNEDGALDITLTGSDIDDDILVFAIAVAPEHGNVTLNNAVASYIPAANYHGSDSFTFTVSDGQAVSAGATVAITVNPASGFSPWLNRFSLSTGAQLDPDGDSIRNAVEYVIGGNPANHQDTALLPTSVLFTGDPIGGLANANYLLFTYRRTDMAKTDPATIITVEWSTDLGGPWMNANGTPGVTTIEENDAADEGVDLVKVFIPCSLSSTGKLFARLGVTVNAP